MTTEIGQPFRELPGRLAVMAALSLALVGADFYVAYRGRAVRHACVEAEAAYARVVDSYAKGRVSYADVTRGYNECCLAVNEYNSKCILSHVISTLGALIAILFFALLSGPDFSALGLTAMPLQDWRQWWTGGFLWGLALIGTVALVSVCWWLLGHNAPSAKDWEWDSTDTYVICFAVAPVSEEVLYRMAVCVPVAARFGPGPAIALSGFLFAGIHLVDGCANPANLVAGFFLAWAYLRSNTIIVPMVLHCLGNLLGVFVLFQWIHS